MDTDDSGGRDVVAADFDAVIDLFRRGIDDLRDEIKRISNSTTLDAETTRLCRRLNDLATALVKERQKVEHHNSKFGGRPGQDILDLDAARREVERRMACLRRAEDP